MFQKITPSDPSLPTVITFSIGNPTPEKVQKVLSLYDGPGHCLMGSFEANRLIGAIGLEVREVTGMIKHIAVVPENRLQGVGKALIRHAIDHFSLQIIQAETDDEAVEFYKKIGFICQPFEEHYGKRYKCEYRA